MQSLLPIINKLAALGTLLLLAATLLTAVFLVLKKRNDFTNFASKNILWIGLFVSTGAALISLYYSDVIGFAPCILCWLQRIFMYPLIPLFGLAIYKKDRGIIDYALLLSSIGFLIAVYHNLVYYFNLSALPCGATGISCVQHFVSELGGLVSIPSMSMVMFLFLIVMMINAKQNNSRASMDGARHDFV